MHSILRCDENPLYRMIDQEVLFCLSLVSDPGVKIHISIWYSKPLVSKCKGVNFHLKNSEQQLAWFCDYLKKS